MKIMEWIGFIIILLSIFSFSYVGPSNMRIVHIGIGIGASMCFTSVIIRFFVMKKA